MVFFSLAETEQFGIPLPSTQCTGICSPQLAREPAYSATSGLNPLFVATVQHKNFFFNAFLNTLPPTFQK